MKRRLSRAALAFTCLALLALVFAAGCGSTSKSTTTKAPGTTLAGAATTTTVAIPSKTYTSDKYGFAFQYPEAWQIDEQPNVAATAGSSAVLQLGVVNPSGTQDNRSLLVDGVLVAVYQLKAKVDASNVSEVKPQLESLVKSLASQAADYKEISALTEGEQNGLPGYMYSYSWTQNGVPLKSVDFFLFNGDKEYEINVQSATTTWDANKPYFDLIVNSLKTL